MLRRLSFVILMLLCPTIRAAEWQYSAKTAQKSGRAFLWIPPNFTDSVFPGPLQHPAAAWPDFKGYPYLAFWHLDEEMARAHKTYGAARKGKKLQVVTFVDARGKAQQSARVSSSTIHET